MDNSKNNNAEKIFKELANKQLKNVHSSKKLQINDIKRISKKISTSIFDNNTCAIWNGYITNFNNASKGQYVNFYFRKKKVALHRLLYANFVGELNKDEYLKFNCENKGKCCNVHHMNRFKYNTNEIGVVTQNRQNDVVPTSDEVAEDGIDICESEEFVLDFN